MFYHLLGGGDAKVFGIEHISELVEFSIKNLSKSRANKKLLDGGAIIISEGDGREGLKDQAPFDIIHVGAGNSRIHYIYMYILLNLAAESIPQPLVDQLGNEGIMVTNIYIYIYIDDSSRTRAWISRINDNNKGHRRKSITENCT